MTHSRVYTIYRSMLTRCGYTKGANPKTLRAYAGRGISIYQGWLESPDAFIKWAMANGYSDELSIDRIDGTKGYCPENCRWVTMEVNMRNKSPYPKVRKGRKLDPDKIREIRAAVAGGLGVRATARLYGIDHSVVSEIKNGKIWSAVE